MKKTRLTYIVSDIDKALAFEWIALHLDDSKFDLSFILLSPKPSHLHTFLGSKGIKTNEIKLRSKFDLPIAFIKLVHIIWSIRPDIVHTHLRWANILGLSAAKFLRIKKRVYTRHHAASNHQYYPHAVKQDRWVSSLATDVVAISSVVEEILVSWESVPSKKVTIIPHGFDLSEFQGVDNQRISDLQNKYNPNRHRPVIGVISRWMKGKGITHVIDAFEQVRQLYPNALLVLANTNGPDRTDIQAQLDNNIPKEYFQTIQFEKDISALYHIFDVFVHVPIDEHFEAFGQTYVEALASGIPSVFTPSGIAREFIVDRRNAMVVDFKNSDQICESILEILSDDELRRTLIKNGKIDVEQFNLKTFIGRLESLYNG